MRWRAAWLAAGLATALLLGGCASDEPLPAVRADEPLDVSLLQLIVTPEKYDGRLVRVKGFCRFQFEDNALYVHREDFEAGISKNGVWLDVGWPVPKSQRELSDEYVLVEAVFSATRKGHLGSYSGSLNDITRLERSFSAKEYERMRRLTFELREER